MRKPFCYTLPLIAVGFFVCSILTLWPGGPQPMVSTLNAGNGAIRSNMAIVPAANGSIDAFAPTPTQLILDVSSYFAP